MSHQTEATPDLQAADQGKQDVTFLIQSGRGEKEFTFRKTTKIKDVTAEAIRVFGYPPGSPFVLVKDGVKLEPERTLVSYHIEDGDVLQLTDVGGGV